MTTPAIPAKLAPGVGYFYLKGYTSSSDGLCKLDSGMDLSTKVNVSCVDDDLVFKEGRKIPNTAGKCEDIPVSTVPKETTFQIFDKDGKNPDNLLCICDTQSCSSVVALNKYNKYPPSGEQAGSGSAKWAIMDNLLGGLLDYKCDDSVDKLGDNYLNALCTGSDGKKFAKNEYICKTKSAVLPKKKSYVDEIEDVTNVGAAETVNCAFTDCKSLDVKMCVDGVDIFDENAKYVTTCYGDGKTKCNGIQTTGTPSGVSSMIMSGVMGVIAVITMI